MRFLPVFLSTVFAIDSTMLMLFMSQKSIENGHQANQMSNLLPFILLDDDKSKSDNKNLMIMMMMQGENMGDSNLMLPLLLTDDDELDFKIFFLYQNMMIHGKLNLKIR